MLKHRSAPSTQTRTIAMTARRVLIITAAVLSLAPMARSGHELPVYPSYYPHEIEIAVVDPQRAGALLAAGTLHAYVGSTPRFDGNPPEQVAAVQSLGSFVLVKLNPASTLARNEASACAAAGVILRETATRGSSLIAHPYPVTPFHGDYLHHADLAEAARARFAAAIGSASLERSPKIRAGDGDWDYAIEEVGVRELVASSAAAVNGWLGPRWTRSGWFHAYRLLADAMAEPEARERVNADLDRLQTGRVAGAAERANLERDLVRRLTTGCRTVVAGYTVQREFFNAGFSTGIENIAADALEGFSSPMFLRTVKLKDFPWNGWLQLGTETPPHAAWNPAGGFTDAFGRLLWFAVGDPAALPSPYDQTWVLNRISEVEAVPRR